MYWLNVKKQYNHHNKEIFSKIAKKLIKLFEYRIGRNYLTFGTNRPIGSGSWILLLVTEKYFGNRYQDNFNIPDILYVFVNINEDTFFYDYLMPVFETSTYHLFFDT